MNEAERLEEYRRYKKISKKDFAVLVGYSSVNSLHAVLNGNRKISIKVLKNLLEKCPELNLKWLLIGKEDMIAKPAQSDLEKKYFRILEENSQLKSKLITLLEQPIEV